MGSIEMIVKISGRKMMTVKVFLFQIVFYCLLESLGHYISP